MGAVSGLRKCYRGCVGMHRVHRAQGLGWLWGSKHDRNYSGGKSPRSRNAEKYVEENFI